MSPYSPERRTALVLCGTGAHGAYHAGVLRALQEAGVKIDVVAGHGIGAGGAALTAIGGSSRLWEDAGIWRSPRAKLLYAWKWTAVAPPIILAVLTILLLATVVVVAAGVALPLVVGGDADGDVCRRGAAPAPRSSGDTPPSARRASGRWWWRLFGAPVDAESARALFCGAIWDLIRGAAPTAQPGRAALGRRYTEVLLENLGQPGFAELLLVATDLDARHDVVASAAAGAVPRDFLAPRAGRNRRGEVLDLTGTARDHAIDVARQRADPAVDRRAGARHLRAPTASGAARRTGCATVRRP